MAGEVLGLRSVVPPAVAAVAPPTVQESPAPAVLATAPLAATPASVMPVRPAAGLDAQLADRERQLREREKEIAARERDLAEQRRVLAEQHRILKVATAPARTMVVEPRAPQHAGAAIAADSVARPAAALQWPPRREPPAARPYRYVVHRRETRSFWRRVRDTLFGIEPVLEDSL
jgi:hypothetical protein